MRWPRLCLVVLVACIAATSMQATRATADVAWCRLVPLERTFCRALALEAPKGILRLAVADTDALRERGLMGVTAIPAGEGMLFVFPETTDQRHDFWMKDTIVPLDMVFVRADGTVTDVAARVPSSKPGAPEDRIARRFGIGHYVIELAAGGAATAGLRPGSRLALPALPAR